MSLTATNSYNGGTTVAGGQLTLDYSSLTPVAGTVGGIVPAASPFTFSGGVLAINGNASAPVNETFISTTVANYGSSIVVTPSSGVTLNLNAITRTGGVLNVPTNAAIETGNLNDPGGILGGYLTVNNTDWATLSSSSTIVPLASYATDNYLSAGNNVDVQNLGLAPTVNKTVNSLHFGTPISGNLASATLSLNSGGILVNSNVGSSNLAITGGALTYSGGTTSSNTLADVVVTQANTAAPFEISSPIVNSGTNSIALTKGGAGALILAGTQPYTGVTTVSGGTLQLGDGVLATSLSTSRFNVGGVLAVVNGMTMGGTHQRPGFPGHDGVGTTTLTGSNTFTGGATVYGGTLNLSSTAGGYSMPGNISLSGNSILNWTAANQFAAGASITANPGSIVTNANANTVANVTISVPAGSVYALGNGVTSVLSNLTVTGTLSVTNGEHDFVNSNTTLTANTMVLNGAIGRLGANSNNSIVNVGGGGLFMNNAGFRMGTNGAGFTAEVNLGGNLTATGANNFIVANYAGPRALDLQGGTRTFNIVNGVTTIPTTVQNGGLVMTGGGTLILSASNGNTYAGGSTLNGGTLVAANGSNGSALGSGTVTVNSGGVLASDPTVGGTISGNVTANIGATLAPGGLSPVERLLSGALNIGGSLSWPTARRSISTSMPRRPTP